MEGASVASKADSSPRIGEGSFLQNRKLLLDGVCSDEIREQDRGRRQRKMDFVIGARKNFTQSALAGRSLVAELADAAEPTPISGEGRRQGLEGDLIWFLFNMPLFVRLKKSRESRRRCRRK